MTERIIKSKGEQWPVQPTRRISNKVLIAIIIGSGTLLIWLTSLIPNTFFQNQADETNAKIMEAVENDQELAEHVDANSHFTAIEADLERHANWDIIPTTNHAEAFLKKSEAKFGHQLFPLLPGYNAYIESMEKADDYSFKTQELASRILNHAEFQLICDMVNDLDAGLDISNSDPDGDYVGGAGETPPNFETLLKGCGDTDLAYLDELELEAEVLASQKAEVEG